MRTLVAIHPKAGHLASVRESVVSIGRAAAEASMRNSFPVEPHVELAFGHAELPNSSGLLLVWSNEGSGTSNLPFVISDVDGQNQVTAAYSGQLLTDNQDLSQILDIDISTSLDHLGGSFSIIRILPGVLEATVSANTGEPLYWAETDTALVVGSRARQVHLIAQSILQRKVVSQPIFDFLGLRELAASGYFWSGSTPYVGTRALTSGHLLRSSGRGARITPTLRFRSGNEGTDGVLDDRLVDEIADALVGSVDHVRRSGHQVELGLTGGRDSRLLLALFTAVGIPVLASTVGYEAHDDVRIARQLADYLGTPHKVSPPTQASGSGTISVEDPFKSALRVVDVTDGMTSAWTTVERYGPYSGRISVIGTGGEILRGGYPTGSGGEVTSAEVVTYLENSLIGPVHYFHDAANQRAADLASRWIDYARSDPYAVADQFYVHHRQARWVGPRNSHFFRRSPLAPLSDNLVLRRVLEIPPRVRKTELLVARLIARLAPGLEKIELQGGGWKFERGEKQLAPSLVPAPVFDWRRLASPEASQYFKRHLLPRRETSPLYRVAKKDSLESMFRRRGLVRHPQIAWNLLTVTALTGGLWEGERGNPSAKLSIEVQSPD